MTPDQIAQVDCLASSQKRIVRNSQSTLLALAQPSEMRWCAVDAAGALQDLFSAQFLINVASWAANQREG
jgi:hypothetical protein